VCFLPGQAVNAQIKGSVRNMRTLMLVAPFAAISNSSVHTLLLITRAVSSFIKLYLLLLFMRVLLSWFPAFNWEDQPWLALRQVRPLKWSSGGKVQIQTCCVEHNWEEQSWLALRQVHQKPL